MDGGCGDRLAVRVCSAAGAPCTGSHATRRRLCGRAWNPLRLRLPAVRDRRRIGARACHRAAGDRKSERRCECPTAAGNAAVRERLTADARPESETEKMKATMKVL